MIYRTHFRMDLKLRIQTNNLCAKVLGQAIVKFNISCKSI